MTRRPRVAIVDPYSAGAELAASFAARGHEAVAVFSSDQTPALFGHSPRRDDYVALVSAASTPRAAIVGVLRQLGVGHVLAGSEAGVDLASELAEQFGL